MSEERQIKGSAFSSFAVLDKVEKLQDHEGYLVWKREVTKILKMIDLWTYIEQPDEPEGTAGKVALWARCHQKTCHILRYVVTGEVYDEIEHHTNASAAWDLLASMFKPRGAGFHNDAFRRLDCLTLKDCENTTDYITKFRALVNELRSFSSEFKMDHNFFIYKFQSNLGPDHASYFERYAQDHDPFNADGKPKYSLSSAMQHFRNTVKNPSAKSHIGLEIAATGLLSHSYASYPPSNTTQRTKKVYFKGSAPNRKITEVKRCTFCQRANHEEEICHRKFPELAKRRAAQSQSSSNTPSNQPSKPSAKRRRPNPNSSTPENNPDPVSFLAIPPIFV